MWSRKDIKENAKALVKANYWKAVVASLILMICGGAGTGSSASSASHNGNSDELVNAIQGLDIEMLLVGIFALVSILAVASIFSLLFSIFVYHPLEVGAKKLFVNCREGKAEFVDLAHGFKNSYLNIVKTLFLRGLFTGLWSLLFVIPGIIKSYEYRMIPYILAENPQMSSKDAFAKSKEMMSGNKWKAFVLDWSFIGWHILGILTLGIAEIFYVAPYLDMTFAELYHELK